jgi:hypothetical protein
MKKTPKLSQANSTEREVQKQTRFHVEAIVQGGPRWRMDPALALTLRHGLDAIGTVYRAKDGRAMFRRTADGSTMEITTKARTPFTALVAWLSGISPRTVLMRSIVDVLRADALLGG